MLLMIDFTKKLLRAKLLPEPTLKPSYKRAAVSLLYKSVSYALMVMIRAAFTVGACHQVRDSKRPLRKQSERL